MTKYRALTYNELQRMHALNFTIFYVRQGVDYPVYPAEYIFWEHLNSPGTTTSEKYYCLEYEVMINTKLGKLLFL